MNFILFHIIMNFYKHDQKSNVITDRVFYDFHIGRSYIALKLK